MALNAGAVVAKFKADVSEMKAGISQVKSQVSGMKSGFASAGKEMASAGQMIATGIGIATVAVVALGVKMAKVTGDLESQRAAFKTLLGTYEEADKALEMIKKDAAATPFEMMGLINANKLLTAVTGNAQKSERMLLNVGKAIAATGGGQEALDRIIVNLQQIGSVGHAAMIDIKQFAFAGIPIFRMLEEATGKSGEALGDMISNGEVTFEMLEKMFEKFGEGTGKFANAFTDQAGTFNQIISNMKDQFAILSIEIMTKSGMFDGIKNGLSKLMNYINEHKEDIINFITRTIKMIKDFAAKVGEFLAPVIAWFKKFFSEAANRKALLIGVLVAIGVALAAFVIALIAAKITIIAIFAAIVLVVGFFYRAWTENWGNIQGILKTAWAVISAIFTALYTVIKWWVDMVIWNFNYTKQTLINMYNAWVAIFNAVGAIFTWLYTTIIKPIIDAWVAEFNFLASIFSWVWNNIVFPILYLAAAIFARIFSEIYNRAVLPVINAINTALTWLGSQISAIFNAIAAFVMPIWNAIKDRMTAPMNQAKGTISSIINSISSFLKSTWNGIKSFFEGMKNSIVSALVKPFEDAKNKIEEIANKIKKLADKINPFHKESPSLVEWVQKGMGKIKDEYAGLYDTMTGFDFRSATLAFSEGMQFSPTFEPAGAKVIQQNINATLQDGMDVDTLAERLAFKYRNQ